MPAFDPSHDPFAPATPTEPTPLSNLDETLAQLLTSYNLLANAVGNVQVDGLVGDTVTRVIGQLAELQHQAKDLNHVLIPMPVIELVDQGKNPGMYNRSFIDRTAAENQFTNGIFNAVREYRDDYARELAVAFPALADSIESTGDSKKEDEEMQQ